MAKFGKRLVVIKETETGMNERFKDPKTGQEFTRKQLVKEIDKGNYPGYHHYTGPNGEEIVRSNPDAKESNNLG